MINWILILISLLLFSCTDPSARKLPTTEPSTKPSQDDTSKKSDTSIGKKTVIARTGELGDFSLSLTPCDHPSEFTKATVNVVPLVVGVAAGEMENNRFSPRDLGRGIVLTSNGFVLTHYHTVSEFDVIRVRLADGSLLAAERMGDDLASDLVLLKIEDKNYPAPNLASANTLKMGQWVASVGSPFGLQQSVSAGIVSSNSRPYLTAGEDELMRYVQSDVAIHPGSSGGPLIDACGRIVAMNSAILGPGMSFSVRIDQALSIAEKLYSDAEFERGYIGILLDSQPSFMDGKSPQVRRVVKGGPADKGGIRKGDTIIKAAGETIESHHQLKWTVARTEAGDPLLMTVKRGDKNIDLTIEVDSRP